MLQQVLILGFLFVFYIYGYYFQFLILKISKILKGCTLCIESCLLNNTDIILDTDTELYIHVWQENHVSMNYRYCQVIKLFPGIQYSFQGMVQLLIF